MHHLHRSVGHSSGRWVYGRMCNVDEPASHLVAALPTSHLLPSSHGPDACALKRSAAES